jgi:hypothetical protein
MRRNRTRRLGSTITTIVNGLALASLVHKIGPRRIGRIAALATAGYLTELRRERARR